MYGLLRLSSIQKKKVFSYYSLLHILCLSAPTWQVIVLGPKSQDKRFSMGVMACSGVGITAMRLLHATMLLTTGTWLDLILPQVPCFIQFHTKIYF